MLRLVMTLGVLRCIIPVPPTFSGQNTRNLTKKTYAQCFELNQALLQALHDQLVQVLVIKHNI